MPKFKIDDYIDVADQTLGVYGNTHCGEEQAGLFDFARLVIDPEFVLVRRSSIERIVKDYRDMEKQRDLALRKLKEKR